MTNTGDVMKISQYKIITKPPSSRPPEYTRKKTISYKYFKIYLQIYIIGIRIKKYIYVSLFGFENRQFAFLPS